MSGTTHGERMNYNKYLVSALVATTMATVLTGCWFRKSKAKTTIVVPDAATNAREYKGDGSIPTQRYVIRMSDGERDWEVEFPEVATGYEMRIPLERTGKSKQESVVWESAPLTDADKELIAELRRANPAMERDGVFVDGRNISDPPPQQSRGNAGKLGATAPSPAVQKPNSRPDETAPAPTRPSYLLGIAEVRRLYTVGNHELAMVRLVALEKAYPDDVQILSMKGSLWLALRQKELARQAWESVLQIDPDNKVVIKALSELH
ncbi:MAG: hypothetical protein MJE77_01935 [Proteobacteria bacterium]|nr:hypothetical protein [Pseudomonadota bacterium]